MSTIHIIEAAWQTPSLQLGMGMGPAQTVILEPSGMSYCTEGRGSRVYVYVPGLCGWTDGVAVGVGVEVAVADGVGVGVAVGFGVAVGVPVAVGVGVVVGFGVVVAVPVATVVGVAVGVGNTTPVSAPELQPATITTARAASSSRIEAIARYAPRGGACVLVPPSSTTSVWPVTHVERSEAR